MPEVFFNRLTEKLKTYFATGGMPEAVHTWVADKDMTLTDKVLSSILTSYDLDFSKHLPPTESQKASLVWHTLPVQLAKENKKFTYNLIKSSARAREYEPSIQWLSDANLIHKVNRISAPALPLQVHEDLSSFKLYAADTGLLRRLAALDASTLAYGDRFFTDFKGSFSENYVLCALAAHCDAPLRYWSVNNPSHEVDFIMQHRNQIIPVEAKAAANTKSKGLKAFRERYADKTDISLRFSLHNLHFQDGILNIPLFLADRTLGLLEKA